MPTNSTWRADVHTSDPDAEVEAGTRIDVVGVTAHAGTRRVLNDVSFSVAPGELVALVGGSGAGKTTLLETMVGLRRVSEGAVLHDGIPARADGRVSGIGYVPQDDIVHRELPLGRVLRHAAGLRLPAGTSATSRVGNASARPSRSSFSRVRVCCFSTSRPPGSTLQRRSRCSASYVNSRAQMSPLC